MRNSQILVVSAVKISKQCLRTASASPKPPTGALPLNGPYWGTFVPQTPWVIAPPPMAPLVE